MMNVSFSSNQPSFQAKLVSTAEGRKLVGAEYDRLKKGVETVTKHIPGSISVFEKNGKPKIMYQTPLNETYVSNPLWKSDLQPSELSDKGKSGSFAISQVIASIADAINCKKGNESNNFFAKLHAKMIDNI